MEKEEIVKNQNKIKEEIIIEKFSQIKLPEEPLKHSEQKLFPVSKQVLKWKRGCLKFYESDSLVD